ncbi:hypothetical protein MTO96_027100 [Rhipicephalus appendiculatus]
MGLSKLDDHFWSQRSTKSCQFILVSVAAILSEIVLGDALTRSMAPNGSSSGGGDRDPGLVLRGTGESGRLHQRGVARVTAAARHARVSPHQVAYGVFFKCTALVAIFLLMNTVGLFVFQGDTLPGKRMSLALNNAFHNDSDFL